MEQGMNAILKRVFRRLHYPLDVILLCVRWYIAYPLSLRHLEEMMAERGVSVGFVQQGPCAATEGPVERAP
ncbi:hypothetical protein WL48_29005 [Burkholderia ubonensis]|nr:hypothetical protein WL48_29005 [Burkholderia ubonensis]KWC40583.1 hypothetical protein WL49_00010 [Burkholderia ubonensis]